MEKKIVKKHFLIGAPSFVAVTAAIVLCCMACQKKAEVRLDVSCTNCTIDGQKEIHNFYSLNDNVALTVKSDEGYSLPDDVKATRGNQQLLKDTDYTYSKDTGELKFVINGDTNVVVIANAAGKKVLNDCSWNEIKEISNSGKASEFFAVGDTKDVTINNQIHKVRIIGFNQDKDIDGNDIGITFEFANLISDTNGYSLATYWKNTNDTLSSSADYLNSSIRKALTKEGTGDLNWFEKDSKSFSTTYANKSVLEMLPSDLSSVLKTVKKTVNVKNNTAWTATEFTDKLFLLNPKELGYSTEYAEISTTYTYYEGHTKETDAIRIKAQVKGAEGARTSSLIGDDLDGEYILGTKFSYAGYHEGQGGEIWLRSPRAQYMGSAWEVSHIGTVDAENVYCTADCVAPAFCI